MPDLSFQINEAEAPPHAATPLLLFKLEIENTPAQERIHSILLQCQIRIEATHRSYTEQERDRLRDLFGEPEQWGRTLRSTLWTHARTNVTAFTGRTVMDLPVECTYDLNVTGTKYFYALEDEEVPLLFLFSGSVFYAAPDGRLQTTRVSWNKECSYRLPVQTWQAMIDAHYPNTAWLYLHRDVFEKLYAYKRRHGIPTWEETIERLLPELESEEVAS